MYWLVVGIGIGIALASAAHAATPRGPEFHVNTTVVDSQMVGRSSRSTVRSGTGATVVVWQSAAQDGSGLGIYAQRYNANGVPQSGEFRVNTTTGGDQRDPGVELDANNNFVFAWSGASVADPDGIVARAYDAAGNPRGGEIFVNVTTAGLQQDPDIAVDNGGDAAIVWSGAGPGDTSGIFVRLVRSDGTFLTGEIRVNTDTTGVQSRPCITADTSGDFVVVWESQSPLGDHDLYLRRFNDTGIPQGGQLAVHSPSPREERSPSVSMASNGTFVVVWAGATPLGDTDIYMRRFTSSGSTIGGAARVNTTIEDEQVDPSVHLMSGGDYVVAWSSDDDSTAAVDWNVRMRQFTKSGAAIGVEERANSTLAGPQTSPTVGLDDLDNFLVVWQGNGNGDANGVFGRLYGLQANADIGLGLATNNATPREGDTVLLTLTVTNHGPDVATNVSIGSLLPAGLTYLADFATQGNYSPTTGAWVISSMAPAGIDVLRLTVRVDVGTAGNTLTHTATLNGLGEVDPVPQNDSASVQVTSQRNLIRLLATQNPVTVLPGQAPLAVYRLRVVNASTVAETLLALACTNTTAGPGSQAERDASWSALDLFVDGSTTPLATASFAAGRVDFTGWSLALAAGDSVVLAVHGGPTTTARDADALDLRLDSADDLAHSGIATMQLMGPLDPPGGFLVDGMSAAQITVHSVPASTFFAGTPHNLALDLTLPANGYGPDRLEKLNIFNHGSATGGVDLDAMQAWVDDGDGRFQDGRERLLGALVFTGNRWELTGLSEPVPVPGLRLYFTVDLSPTAGLGRTVRLGLNGDPDVPIGMASGNDGPIDASVANRYAQSVSTADRVVLSTVATTTSVVRPGSTGVPLLQVVGSNSYASVKTLTEIIVDNSSTSANGGNRAQLDATVGQLRLVDDTDNDGFLEPTDAVLASSYLTQGRAAFSGIDWTLPAGGSRSFFVTADVVLEGCADSDVLGVAIDGALEVTFDDPTAVVASWPLRASGVRIDGLVAAQLELGSALGVTLGPNEGPALALDLRVPANGYAADVLQGVSLLDLGTAAPADLAAVRLFRDGGDGVFTPGSGDDVDIAPLVSVDGRWKSPQLSESIGPEGLRLFVGVTVADTPTDSATVQLAVPVDGILVLSGNDGPLDVQLVNPEALLLSTAPLSVTLGVAVTRANVGQDIAVQMTVRNVGDEIILGVAPSPLDLTGDGGAILITPPAVTSADLVPGDQVTFDWTYRGTAVGDLVWSGDAQGVGAIGGLVRRSLTDRSGSVRVLRRATSMSVEPVGSVPFSINRGETGVVPFSLTFSHDGDAQTSDIVLHRLRVRVEDDAGNGIVPAAILAALVLREGARTYYASSALPGTGDTVDLVLSTPLVITPSEPTTVSFQCDIAPATTVPVFRLALVDASAFVATDATDGAAVVVHRDLGFPIVSGTGQVRAAPTELDVAALPGQAQRLGRGQQQVAVLGLKLSNQGIPNVTTNVRVGSFELQLVDANGAVVAAGRAFESLRIKSGTLTLEEIDLAADTDSLLTFALSIPALVPAGADNDLYVLGDVAAGAPLGTYRFRLGSPATFDARDDNTHALVPVVYATTPLEGMPLAIEAAAESLRVQGTPQFPSTFTVGTPGQAALITTLRHPGPPGSARLRVDRLTFLCRDEARRVLGSAAYLDRIAIVQGTTEIAQLAQFPASGGFDVALQDFYLEPGATVSFTVNVDIEATAPATFFELLLGGFTAVDANLATPVISGPEPGAELPLSSGLAKLGLPGTELAVGMQSRTPAVLASDGSEVLLARVSLRNTAASGAGPIDVRRLVCRASDRDRNPIALGAAATGLVLRLDGNVVSQSGTLSPDSITVAFTPTIPIRIEAGATVWLDVLAAFHGDTSRGGFRLGVDENDVEVVQPANTATAVHVESEAGQAFPLWTEPGSFGVTSLRESFANFPNPFGPGRQNTTFTYYLPRSGRVTLRILTPRGETVTTLLDQVQRPAGLHQSDVWGGRNGQSLLVTNGVYIAELDVVQDDGTHDRVLRKVAVVR